MRESWLLHPVDRALTIYRPREDGAYGKPDGMALEALTRVEVIGGLEILWRGSRASRETVSRAIITSAKAL